MGQNFRIAPSVPLNLGWIPYWNLHPMRRELERSIGHELEVKKGLPSQVNRWLADGKVRVAPCSSISLLHHPTHEIAFPLGIASNGPVHSVYLGLGSEDSEFAELVRARQSALKEAVKQTLRVDLDARRQAATIFRLASSLPPVDPALVPPLAVTPASATSATLARLLYRLWFGETIYDLRASQSGPATASAALRRPVELLIGDEALAKRSNFRWTVDLGEVWRELTELPFVFAVWQTTRRTMSPYWRHKFMEAAELAQARMRVEPCHYLPDQTPTDSAGRPIDLPAYWKSIQYRLAHSHFRGLTLFLALGRQLEPELHGADVTVSLARWESRGTAAYSI